jgi:hypothetical protein
MIDLKPLIAPYLKTCSILELKAASADSLPVTGTHFGGAPYARPGEEWPLCQVCHQPLSFIFQVNTIEGHHDLPPELGLVSLYYCWDCRPQGYEEDLSGAWLARLHRRVSPHFYYALSIPEPEPRSVHPCSVNFQPHKSLPDWEGLSVWAPQIFDLSASQNLGEPWAPYDNAAAHFLGEPEFTSALGGYPQWLQGEDTPTCPTCERNMVLLVQLDSERTAGLDWGSSGCLYLFFCPEHPSLFQMRVQTL